MRTAVLEALHLDAAERPVAVLLEGPALRLRRPGVADVFAPLPRLSRVVVHGPRVQWRTEALMACAEAGVPVLLMGGQGALRAVLLPVTPPAMRRDLAAALDTAATEPGFRGKLEDFCRAELRRALLQTLRAERIATDQADLRPAGMRALLLSRGPGSPAAEKLWSWLRGLGTGSLAEGLARRGVGAQFLARRSGCFPLPEMLGEALVLPLCFALMKLAGALAEAPDAEARRAVVRMFEQAQLGPRRDQMLARLAVRLASDD